jgi:hypothetical protein
MMILVLGLALLVAVALAAAVRAVATDGYRPIPADPSRLPVADKPGFWQRRRFAHGLQHQL